MTSYMSKDQGDFGLSVHDPLKGEQYVTVCVWQLDRERAGRVDSAAGLHPSAAGE